MKKLLYLFVFMTTVGSGLILSQDTIPNQEGYFELAWNFSHLATYRTLLAPAVTPLNFIVGAVLERNLSISAANAWKIMDLTFAAALAVFLSYVFITVQKPRSLIDKLMPLLLMLSSLGFIFSFTSQSGEGMPIFFAIIGVYLWSKKRFLSATVFFSLSFLSKYTIYLVGPGIFVWTILNWKFFTKREIRHILISAFLGVAVFLLYNSIKDWGDIKLQASYIDDFSPTIILTNLPYFIVALFLGAPIVVIFSTLYPNFRNLFWLCGASALLMLTRRYFYWNHTQQIISFWLLYFFSHPSSLKFLQKRFVVLQIILALSLVALFPLYSKTIPIFYKQKTITQAIAVEDEIKKDYHGGQIGYYLNRRFDEPFPAYEISYLPANDYATIEATVYIVIPAYGPFPPVLENFPHCNFTFHKQVADDYIYKVSCAK